VQKEDKQEINLSQVIYGKKKGRKVKKGAPNDEERSHNCVCTEPPVYDSPLLFIFNSSLFLYSLFIVYHFLTFRVCPVLSNRILVFYILCNRQCIAGASFPNARDQTLVPRQQLK
jgi:hypothetical protein